MNSNVSIELSYTNQNKKHPGWGVTAQAYLRKFVRTKAAQQEWTIEHFREYAESRGLLTPGNGSAYGGVMRRAKEEGLIKFIGYRPASRPVAHKKPLAVWSRA